MKKESNANGVKKGMVLLLSAILFLCTIISVGYCHYYDIPELTISELEQSGGLQMDHLMIVAHPDDETLWGGAHLAEGNYLIVCLTHGKDSIRSAELQTVAEESGNACLILQYPDKTFGKRDDWSMVKKQIQQDLMLVLNSKDWESVATHNASGEYGHIHHQMTHQLVVKAYQESGLSIPLYCFGTYYSRKNLLSIAADLPQISETALQKKETLLKQYHSQEQVVENLSHMNPYENWMLYDGTVGSE